MAQDDYYYEIQLTNKQLVFYFLAGATVLIISFLAGIMVGRGVDARSPETRVVGEEPKLPAVDDAAARTPPVTIESYSYPKRLVADNVPEHLEKPTKSAPPPTTVKPATPTPQPARPTPTKAPATPTPRPATPRPPTTQAGSSGGSIQVERLVIQVGAFRERNRAETVMAQLRKKGYPAHVGSAAGERGGLFNVYVGPYSTRDQAERVKSRLVTQERFKPFIVRQ